MPYDDDDGIGRTAARWTMLRTHMDVAAERGDWIDFVRLAGAAIRLAERAFGAHLPTTEPGAEPAGPTGEHPRGKLVPDDEGELNITIGEYQDAVVINFGVPVRWVGMPSDVGRRMGESIIETANKIDDAAATGRVAQAIAELGSEHKPPPEWQAFVEGKIGKPVITIHVLDVGEPLCRFSSELPGRWPFGHIWCRPHEFAATRAACIDPDHEVHSVFRHVMCTGCEAAMGEVPPPLPPAPNDDDERSAREATVDEALRSLEREAGRAAMSALLRFAGVFLENARRGSMPELREWVASSGLKVALTTAELGGELPEFYGLCFQSLLAATKIPEPESVERAEHYLGMAELVAASGTERGLAHGIRQAIKLASMPTPRRGVPS